MKENRAAVLEKAVHLAEIYECFRGPIEIEVGGELREVLISLADVENCFYLIAIERKKSASASEKKKKGQAQ